MLKVPSTISAIKMAPASGVPYAAATPAAPPQATNTLKCAVPIYMKRPTNDAASDDRCTIAPSRPMEPPDATVNKDDNDRNAPCRNDMRPSPMATASMYSQAASVFLRLANHTKSPAISPPNVGNNSRLYQGTERVTSDISPEWPTAIRWIK